MPDTEPTTHCQGEATVRQRPTVALMRLLLRAAEPTLERSLVELKMHVASASRWVRRLGAADVLVGEPHFADQTDADPVTKIHRETARRLSPKGAAPADDPKKAAVVVLTGVWDIAARSADDTLLLVDRLRFEAANQRDDPPAEEADEEPPEWASPQEQMAHMMAQMSKLREPTEDDGRPQFLFVTRLAEDVLRAALAEASDRARQQAARLAAAVGKRVGRMSSIHLYGANGIKSLRSDHMSEQRCVALLAGTGYTLGEYDTVSDDPRSADIQVSVNVIYTLE